MSDRQMKYRDAMRILDCMAADMFLAIEDMPKYSPMYDVIRQRLDAIDLAQSVLLEKRKEKE